MDPVEAEPEIAVAIGPDSCPWPSLARWIELDDRPIPVRLSARIVAEVAKGDVPCHERWVIHRDISSANIPLFPRWPSPTDEGAPRPIDSSRGEAIRDVAAR